MTRAQTLTVSLYAMGCVESPQSKRASALPGSMLLEAALYKQGSGLFKLLRAAPGAIKGAPGAFKAWRGASAARNAAQWSTEGMTKGLGGASRSATSGLGRLGAGSGNAMSAGGNAAGDAARNGYPAFQRVGAAGAAASGVARREAINAARVSRGAAPLPYGVSPQASPTFIKRIGDYQASLAPKPAAIPGFKPVGTAAPGAGAAPVARGAAPVIPAVRNAATPTFGTGYVPQTRPPEIPGSRGFLRRTFGTLPWSPKSVKKPGFFGNSTASQLYHTATTMGTVGAAGMAVDRGRELENAGNLGAATAVMQMQQLPWYQKLALPFASQDMTTEALARNNPIAAGYYKHLQNLQPGKPQSGWDKFKQIINPTPYT